MKLIIPRYDEVDQPFTTVHKVIIDDAPAAFFTSKEKADAFIKFFIEIQSKCIKNYELKLFISSLSADQKTAFDKIQKD